MEWSRLKLLPLNLQSWIPQLEISWLTRKRAYIGGLVFILSQICLLLLRQKVFTTAPSLTIPEHYHILSNLTAAYTSNAASARVGVIIATHSSTVNLDWVLDYCQATDSVPFIYTTNETPEKGLLVPATIQGREAAAYLSYVVDFYDHLPDYSIFLHANKEQWHNDLFGPVTVRVLDNLRFEAVTANGYVNLRCKHDPGCPIDVSPLRPTKTDIEKDDIRAHFSDVYQELFNVTVKEVPDQIGNICCGQFAVTRERIRERPKEDYERILYWAATTDLVNSFGVGWVMEKLWHIVFGMDAIHCPIYEQCRCDIYGWCGPLDSGTILQPVRANATSSIRRLQN